MTRRVTQTDLILQSKRGIDDQLNADLKNMKPVRCAQSDVGKLTVFCGAVRGLL